MEEKRYEVVIKQTSYHKCRIYAANEDEAYEQAIDRIDLGYSELVSNEIDVEYLKEIPKKDELFSDF